jgi:uncharacterized repeat protein (TIGR01451 family)
MVFLGLGALGAYFGVGGQEPRIPWPPPPVTPPDNVQDRDYTVPRREVPSSVSRPSTTSKYAAPDPVALVNYEAKNTAVAAPPPVMVEVPEKQGPIIVTIPDEKPIEPLIVLPPLDPRALDPKTLTSPSPAPPAPMPITAPVVLESTPPLPAATKQPPSDIIIVPDVQPRNPAPAPQPVLQPVPQPVQQPLPQVVQQPAPPVTPPAPEIPTKPKAFQLVNPLRAPTNNNAPPLPLPDPYPAPERRVVPAQPVAQVNPALPGTTDAAMTTPQVSVEKRGPNAAHGGEPLQFVIIVRNTGATPASQIRVEDDIPAGARVVFAEPQPIQQNNRAIWILPALEPGAEKLLKIELQAPGAGEMSGVTSVTVSASTGARTRSQQENLLSLSVKTPNPVPVGFPVVFEVIVTNRGKEAATGMVLHGKLSAGLSHPAGKEIEADVGDIGAGASKTFKVSVKTLTPGKQTIEMRITTQNGQEASGAGAVQVNKSLRGGVSIQQAPNIKVFLDKEADLKIEVTNNQTQDLQNVAVMDVLPEGVDFISASDQGLFRHDSRTAHWLINNLAPGQTQNLTVRVKARASGHFDNEAIARTESQQETQSSAKVQVQGLSDLTLTITDSDNPLEMGKATVYEIRVVNKGSAPATGVQVQATLPQGMMPAQVRGPSAHHWNGKQVIFEALPKLQAQGQAVFYVSALAQAAGDQRFLAQVMSEQNTQPIIREQRTFVYRD